MRLCAAYGPIDRQVTRRTITEPGHPRPAHSVLSLPRPHHPPSPHSYRYHPLPHSQPHRHNRSPRSPHSRRSTAALPPALPVSLRRLRRFPQGSALSPRFAPCRTVSHTRHPIAFPPPYIPASHTHGAHRPLSESLPFCSHAQPAQSRLSPPTRCHAYPKDPSILCWTPPVNCDTGAPLTIFKLQA